MVKLKAFFIIFKELSLKQVKHFFFLKREPDFNQHPIFLFFRWFSYIFLLTTKRTVLFQLAKNHILLFFSCI